jgi:hypothetical protein
MELIYYFTVKLRERGSDEVSECAFVRDANIYSLIQDIAFEHWDEMPPRRDYMIFRIKSLDAYLPRVFHLLEEAGLHPHFGEYLPTEKKYDHFLVRRLRQYNKKDYKQAEYFTIHRWSDMTRVFTYAGVRDGLIVGEAKGAKWKTRYGLTTTSSSARFVNGELKRELEQADLKGLTFLSVIFDDPEKARGDFWQVSSTIEMPRCQLPLIKVPARAGVFFQIYDDGGHFPQELVFNRSEVKALAAC